MRELRQANTEKGWDKYMKKITGVWIIGILALIVLAGCGQREQGKEIEKKAVSIEEENKTTIGLSFDSFVIERWLRDRDAFVAAADNLGAEVNVQNANGDVEEQIEQIRYLIKKKVDVMVVVAADCMEISEVMLEAKAAGIPTISYDRLIQNADTDLYISFDNEKVGQYMAEVLVENIPEGGKIFMIQVLKRITT